jgi:hypothetical protein
VRHFNKRHPAIVQAGGGNARDVDGFLPVQLLADGGKALCREIGVGAVNVPAPKISLQRSLSSARGEGAQVRMTRSGARNAESPESSSEDNLSIARLKVR